MLTLRDRLSHLSFRDAARLLGPGGEALVRQGGRRQVSVLDQAQLTEERLTLDLGDAVAEVALDPARDRELRFSCSACDTACEHLGALFAVVLEEKLALGLAAPPPEPEPQEALTDEELVARALAEREVRAAEERMTVKALEPKVLWSDYAVTSRASGKTYRVALRGWERGESFCTCADFRRNTLGTCKHLLHVLARARKRFSKAEQRRPFRPDAVAVHLRYGEALELRVLVPEGVPPAAEAVLAPVRGRAIDDPRDLVARVQRLEALGHAVTVYPDAELYLETALLAGRLAARAAEIRRDPARHPLRQELLKVELLPYQLDGIAFAVGAGRAILADDMGLGKTIQGIGVAELLAREAGIARVLVVCPASLKAQWASEVERFSGRPCQLVVGTAEERAGQYRGDAFFTVCNYEQVLRDIVAVEAAPWDLIVLDEGQRIKNWEARTSRTVKSLRSRFALVLSGTPLENRLDELYSVVEFIDDRRLGPAFRFFHRHRVADDKGKVLGYRNLDELRDKLRPVLLRRTRAQVARQLPPRTTEIRRIPPTAEQADLHEGHKRIISTIVRKPYLTEMDLLRLQKALLLARMAANSTFLVDKQPPGYSSKLAELATLLDGFAAEEDRKIVLFSEWTTMLGLVEPLLAERRLPFVRLDGSVPQQKRQALVQRFQKDPACRLFLTTNAGATGLNLQAANTVVNVDLPWNPAVLEQRIARAHRMGQKRPVQVYLLVTEDTIEENLLSTLAAKHELALAALDPDSDVTAVDLASGIEELKRRLEVLVGTRPAAPVDVSQQAAVEREAREAAERRGRVAAAGGQLLAAAFSFMGELAGPGPETEMSRQMAEAFKARLAECLDQDDQGQWQMTVTIPDPAVLDSLAQTLARLAAPRRSPP